MNLTNVESVYKKEWKNRLVFLLLVFLRFFSIFMLVWTNSGIFTCNNCKKEYPSFPWERSWSVFCRLWGWSHQPWTSSQQSWTSIVYWKRVISNKFDLTDLFPIMKWIVYSLSSCANYSQWVYWFLFSVIVWWGEK